MVSRRRTCLKFFLRVFHVWLGGTRHRNKVNLPTLCVVCDTKRRLVEVTCLFEAPAAGCKKTSSKLYQQQNRASTNAGLQNKTAVYDVRLRSREAVDMKFLQAKAAGSDSLGCSMR